MDLDEDKQECDTSPIIERNQNQHPPPCYLPQQADVLQAQNILENKSFDATTTENEHYDYSPLAAVAGIRPVVSPQGINRFSTNEWRANNKATVDQVDAVLNHYERNKFSCKKTVMEAFAFVEKTEKDSVAKLRYRANELNHWKTYAERYIGYIGDELVQLESQRRRITKIWTIYQLAFSIVKECLAARNSRPIGELVRDKVEEELRKEMEVVSDAQQLFQKILLDIDGKLVENRKVKSYLESDWNDKTEAHDIEILNLSLNKASPMLMFLHGTAKLPAGQTSHESWENNSQVLISMSEETRASSKVFRNNINMNVAATAQDVAKQADIVTQALSMHISCVVENIRKFERDLVEVLEQIKNTELLINELQFKVRLMDGSMKLVETRLSNRSFRANFDDCRDHLQYHLIDQVKTVQSGVSAFIAQLKETEKLKQNLLITRQTLENEILCKRRALWIDRERVSKMRMMYPSFAALNARTEN